MALVGIGDEVLVTGQVRELQRTDPRKVRIRYERNFRWYPVWDNNPRIAAPQERGNFNVWCPRENWLRPYCVSKSTERWEWRPYRPPVGELYFTEAELGFSRQYPSQVVVETYIKAGASPNKQWGRDRWRVLGKLLKDASIEYCQIGAMTPESLPGASFVRTPTIRHAAAIISRAKAVICHEGALHHIAAAVGVPAVVIYGGYIAPTVTGYAGQEALFTGGGLGCGMRLPCPHCEAAMAAITPEMVMEALSRIRRRE